MRPHSRRILCVDDDDTCSLLSGLLTPISSEVVTVRTMQEALALIRSDSFSLFILDHWLPGGGSGVELCRAIRASDAETPVLFYTAAAYDSDRQLAIEAGAHEYLVKPRDIGKLLETVQKLLLSGESDGGRDGESEYGRIKSAANEVSHGGPEA